MYIAVFALLLQVAISPPEPPPWPPRYTVAQGQAVVVKLDPATCVAGPVVVLDRTFSCRPDSTIIVGVPTNASVDTHWVVDVHDHDVASLEVAGADFRSTRPKPTPRPPSPRLKLDKRRKDEAFSTHTQQRWTEYHLRVPLRTPVSTGYRVSDRFGPYHAGTDIAASEEGGWRAGAPDARSIAGGVVVLSERLLLEGNAVIIYHGSGMYTAYCHLARRAVKAGDMVSAGTRLGAIGGTGAARGIHLHLTMHINGVAVDPLAAIVTLNNSSFLQP